MNLVSFIDGRYSFVKLSLSTNAFFLEISSMEFKSKSASRGIVIYVLH